MSSDDGSSFEDPSVRPFLMMLLFSSHKFTKSALNNKLNKNSKYQYKKTFQFTKKVNDEK
jgi:hypothetical protein